MSIARSKEHIRAEQRRFRRAQSGKAWKMRELPQFYYLNNFNSFLAGIHARHFDLLGQDDLGFLTAFQSLPKGAQATYVRMANRRGYVFDRDRFEYAEIPEQDRQWATLQNNGFAEAVGTELFRPWLESLSKPDLALLLSDMLCETLFKKSWKKSALVDVACTHIDPADAYVPDRYIGQGRRDTLQYMLFLYFGRIEDNLQVLTHRDLGLVRLPDAEPHAPAFDSVLEAKTAFFYADALHRFRHGRDVDAERLCLRMDDWPDPQCETSARHRDKLLQKLGGWSERRGQLDDALSLYGRSDAPLCNERVVRIRWNRDEDGDRDWCKGRLEAMIENPASDQEADFAGDFYARKFRKKRTSATTDLLRTATELTLDEAYRNQPERAALHHYKVKGLTAFRTENVPWRNLFGLLLWDLLHEGGTSRRAPGSLRDGSFYPRHSEEIERRLARLDQPSVVMLDLLKMLSMHYGQDNALVHW
ncbi:MAG: hypothetical protein AAF311_11725, partial [Pseudomonadota bacterium]